LSRVERWLIARAVPAAHLPRICGVWSLIAASDCLDVDTVPVTAAASFDAAAAMLLESDGAGTDGGGDGRAAGLNNGRAAPVLREVAALRPSVRGLPALREAVMTFLQAAAAEAHGESARGEVPFDRLEDFSAAWQQRSAAAAHLLLTAVDVSADSGLDDARLKPIRRSLTLACSLGRFARRLRMLRRSVVIGRWPLPCAASPVPWQELLARSRASVAQGYAVDHELLSQVVKAVSGCAESAWKQFETCDALPEQIGLLPPPGGPGCLTRAEARAAFRLWLLRGHLDLLVTGLWNHETLLEEPPVSATRHLRSGVAALLRVRIGPRAAAPDQS